MVKEFLGHPRSVTVMELYAHLAPPAKTEAVAMPELVMDDDGAGD